MSTRAEIEDYIDYLKKNTGVNVKFGKNDSGSNEKPLINIVPDKTMGFAFMNVKSGTVTIPLSVNIEVDRDHELDAFDLFDLFIKKTNQYNDQKNHLIDEDIEPSYTTSTYMISFGYILKLIIQDTEA